MDYAILTPEERFNVLRSMILENERGHYDQTLREEVYRTVRREAASLVRKAKADEIKAAPYRALVDASNQNVLQAVAGKLELEVAHSIAKREHDALEPLVEKLRAEREAEAEAQREAEDDLLDSVSP